MNILLLGSGGREHALAWAISASPLCDALTCAPGNAGIAQVADCRALDIMDNAAVVALAKAEQIDVMLGAIQATAPDAVEAMGGRDALARRSEMTCLGPVPRLDAAEWERMSLEYEDRREHGSVNRGH